jgi:hypothetical protein
MPVFRVSMLFSIHPMKRIAPLFLFCLLLTAGCVRRYEVTLSNQRVITAYGKPKYDKKQGTFRFKDVEGNVHVVPAFTVQEYHPR